MNQTFSSIRLSSYFRLYAHQNARRILMLYSFVVLIPVMAMLIFPYLTEAYRYESYGHNDRMWEIEMVTFDFLLILMGAYFASLFYSGLSEKEKRISFLTTPASAFEKFLTMFAVYVVGFMVLFFLSTFLADIIRVAVYTSTAHENGAFIDFIPLKYLMTQGFSREIEMCVGKSPSQQFYYQMAFLVNSAVFGLFFFLQAFFVLGSSVWPKNSFIKTFMSGSVIFFICLFLFFFGMHSFFDLSHGIDMRFGEHNPAVFGSIIAGTAGVFSLACWIISYIRFREWEAIKRW